MDLFLIKINVAYGGVEVGDGGGEREREREREREFAWCIIIHGV